MSTRYTQAATKQLAPIYDEQITGLQKQIPAIQNLYQTLTQALQSQNQMQLDTGTQNIVEDASARGVLRSTLPVDARQSLTAQLGAALNQGLGQLGLQQQEQIGGVRTQIGGLKTEKVGAITDLAKALETGDLEKQRFALEKLNSERDYQIKLKTLAQSATSTKSEFDPSIAVRIGQTLSQLVGSNGKVSPADYGEAKTLWVSQGGKASEFDATFGPKFAEGSYSPIQQYYGGSYKE